jgi:hypothetical protein
MPKRKTPYVTSDETKAKIAEMRRGFNELVARQVVRSRAAA